MVAPFEGVPGVVAKISDSEYGHQPYLLRAILVQQPARVKLGARPVLSACLDTETAHPIENGRKFEFGSV